MTQTRICILAAIVLLASASHAALLGADPCVAMQTFADGKQPLREIFVATTGRNSTGNGSRSNPFQTLSRATQGVQPGDAIRLLPGTYAGGTFLGDLAGTSNAPIWLGGVPGLERPVIAAGANGIHFSRVRYLVVENLEITGATANGINCDDGGDYANADAARRVLFRNLFIHDIGTGGNSDGLKLSGVNDFIILDCTFARLSAGGSGIDHVGCHRGLIARSTFTDAGSNAIQCKGGSEDIEIRANRFINGGGRAINIGGSTGFEFFRPPLSRTSPNFEARNIRVIANLFRGADAPVAFVGTVNSLVANNTIVEPRRWILRILQETVSSGGYTFVPSGRNEFINNLVSFDRSQISTHVNIGSNTDAASFQFANNLWYAANQPSQSRPTLPSAEAQGVYGLNPLFRAAAAGDFSVADNSPAAGKGQALPNVRSDLMENCYSKPPTIGAFEANPPPSPRADTDGDFLPDAWEQEHGLDKNNPADASLDADGDGLSNRDEYLAGTDPKDRSSAFVVGSAQFIRGSFSFRYTTVTGRLYRVQSRELAGSFPWTEASVTSGNETEIEFRQQASTGAGKMFRVLIEPEP